MRLLRVVGLSDDGAYLHLASVPADDAARADAAGSRDRRPGFRVPVDDALRAALRGEDPTAVPEPSALSPREIQARLRAGETVEQVARAARVPVRRVERFAGPVESERAQVVAAAQAATMHRTRGGESAAPLGELVDAALGGLREPPAWSARRDPDGTWRVTLTWTARGAARSAEWTWRPAERTLQPVDTAAARLGWRAPEPPARGRTTGPDRPARGAKASPPAARKRRAATPATTPSAAPARKAATREEATPKAPVTTPRRRPAGGGSGALPSWDEVLLGASTTRPRSRRSGG